MKRLHLLIGLPAALAAAAPALAQEAAPPAKEGRQQGPQQPLATIIVEPVAMMIAAFDADGDTRVTRAEFDAGLRASFDAFDAGGRGSIGYIGFSDWALRYLGDRNALPGPFEIDTDGDNRITFAELADRFAAYFTRFDTDKDGAIVRAELVTLRGPGIGARPEGGKERRGGGDRPRRELQPTR
ncbi:EF-hand domain-containing protein [Sphingomonas canadensis]|uniref:EF-hand domain-containing protein n=1 Tax=Sphingomonas canadensis TaxID=1219257 RepID=A0ABW3H603_9SPHN|nr:EF-hand domain-containing protein [Sphingomonas canadensis]MCW3836411.1 EF-hand domain-containing protein [Sphingomonas canadensis]